MWCCSFCSRKAARDPFHRSLSLQAIKGREPITHPILKSSRLLDGKGKRDMVDETSPTHDCFSSLSTHESQNNTKSNHEWNTTTANPMCGTKSGTSILAHPRLGPSIVITDHTSLCFLCPPTRCVNRERQPLLVVPLTEHPTDSFGVIEPSFGGQTMNEVTVDPSQQSRSGLCCWVVLHSLLPT
jgi:hypothetical protein